MRIKDQVKKTVLLATVACLSSAPSVYAADEEGYTHYPSTAKERKGLGLGVLLGALAGGPPGAMLGAFGGGMIGRQMSMEEQLTQARSELARTRAELQRVATARERAELQEADGGDDRHALMLASATPVPAQMPADLLQAIEEGFFITLQFRTADSRIEPRYQDHLQRLAAQLSGMKGLAVYLDGYADERGEEGLNLLLSEKRLQEVRGVLLRGGVEDEAIILRAHGESTPVNGKKDPESLGFERRVVISFARRELP